jgi:hypothetical protein
MILLLTHATFRSGVERATVAPSSLAFEAKLSRLIIIKLLFENDRVVDSNTS